VVVILLAGSSRSATAAVITNSEVVDLTPNIPVTGNGTLDMILFTESAGGSGNSSGSFSGDNSNTDEPTGGSGDSSDESYITSIGTLRDFYRLNFPDGQGGSSVNQFSIFVDVNETGQVLTINLDKCDVWIDYSQTFGDDRDNPNTTDISSALQNSTGTGFSGGTLEAYLDSGPKLLTYHNNGAGHGDMIIHTGINPFDSAYSDSTRILVNLGLSDMSDGGETVFLSGKYDPNVPEPTTLGLLAASGVALVAGRRRRA